jgi:hypothetical protein
MVRIFSAMQRKRVYANLRKPLISLVPEARIELAWTQGPEDFESDKSQTQKSMISVYYLISLAFLCLRSWEMLGFFRKNETWRAHF